MINLSSKHANEKIEKKKIKVEHAKENRSFAQICRPQYGATIPITKILEKNFFSLIHRLYCSFAKCAHQQNCNRLRWEPLVFHTLAWRKNYINEPNSTFMICGIKFSFLLLYNIYTLLFTHTAFICHVPAMCKCEAMMIRESDMDIQFELFWARTKNRWITSNRLALSKTEHWQLNKSIFYNHISNLKIDR